MWVGDWKSKKTSNDAPCEQADATSLSPPTIRYLLSLACIVHTRNGFWFRLHVIQETRVFTQEIKFVFLNLFPSQYHSFTDIFLLSSLTFFMYIFWIHLAWIDYFFYWTNKSFLKQKSWKKFSKNITNEVLIKLSVYKAGA